MTARTSRLYAYALTLSGAALSIAGIGGVAYAHAISADKGADVACEVFSQNSNGGFAVQGVFHAPENTHGSYQLSVKSVGGANSTNINQAGGFAAGVGDSVILGEMNLAGSAIYDVTLKVNANGVAHECGGRIGAA